MNPGKVAILGARSTGMTTPAGRFDSNFSSPDYAKSVGVRIARSKIQTDDGERVLIWRDSRADLL